MFRRLITTWEKAAKELSLTSYHHFQSKVKNQEGEDIMEGSKGLEKVTASTISQAIEPKVVKVSTDYGAGTGYWLDPENGILLTSFHLIGSVNQLAALDYGDVNGDFILRFIIKHLLHFIDDNGNLQRDANLLRDVEDITLPSIDVLKNLLSNKINVKSLVNDRVPICLYYPREYAQKLFNKHRTEIIECLKTVIANPEVSKNVNLNDDIFDFFLANDILIRENNEIKFDISQCELMLEKEGPLLEIAVNVPRTFKEEDIVEYYTLHTSVAFRLEGSVFDALMNLRKRAIDALPNAVFHVEYSGKTLKATPYFHATNLSTATLLQYQTNFARYDTIPLKITHFEDGTTFESGQNVIDAGAATIPFLSDKTQLQHGQDIYFAGFPLTQDYYTFSRGMLAAIDESTLRDTVTIEAPIAPGNSGGPVFTVIHGDLYFLGLISSEVAYITDEVERIRKLQSMGQIGIELTTGGGIEFFRTVLDTFDMLLRNLATGKGNFIWLENFDQLFNLSNLPNFYELDRQFLVPRPVLPPPKKLRLYEYINERKMTRLTGKDMIAYIKSYPDEEARKVIFRHVNLKEPHSKNYIQLPIGQAKSCYAELS